MTQVIIDDIVPRTQLVSAAGQTVFNTNWTVNALTDVVVYARLDGVVADDETQVVSTSDYNVTLIGGSQTVRVTFLVGRTLDEVITIVRNTPAERLNLYINTNFVPSMLNNDFGILTLVDQQSQMYDTVINPRYNVSETIEPDSMLGGGDIVLPILPPGFGWRKNLAGTEIEAISIPDGGFAPQIGSFVTVLDERSQMPNSFPLFDLGNSSTSGMGIPAGTSAERVVPVPPNISLRFNTDLGYIEAYIGGNWVEIPSGAAGLFLPLVGGTMSGNIDMDSNIIEGLPIPTLGSEAANKDYVDSQIGLSGTVTAASINEIAFYPANGDTVDGIPTANSAIFRTDASGIPGWSASLTDGQVLIGDTSGTPVPGTLTAGPGISIANGPGAITISGTGSGIGWTEVTGTTQAMAADNGYVANNGALVVFTLPATAAFGTVINLVGKGAGGWQIDQNASQNIQVGSVSSTVGAGGSVASTNRYDSIELLCTTANTTWTVLGGPQGNLTIV